MTKKTDKDFRIVEQVVNAQLAERDAEIADLRKRVNEAGQMVAAGEAERKALTAQVAEWERVGNAIMQCAVGRDGPLSDSDVCGEINALRAQVAELQAWKAAVPVVGIKRLFRDAPYDASYADEVWQWIEKYTLNR